MSWTAHKDEDSLKEHFCDAETLLKQAAEVAELIKRSKHLVVFTGAGISTSAGIPDFRGPQGVWTLRAQGKDAKSRTSVHKACPTEGHMALVALQRADLLKYVISQNVDGLHRRSGLEAGILAELHGNTNLETCRLCSRQFLRDYGCRNHRNPVTSHETGRICVCGGKLYDSIVNFGESLPEKAISGGYEHSGSCDLMLVLGSSLTVSPANDMPRMAKERAQAALVICNLQKTPLDNLADFRVFAKTDDFLMAIMKRLDIAVPEFKLSRYLRIIQKSTNDCNSTKLIIEGVEKDATPATIFSAVKILLKNPKFEWEKCGEPYETEIKIADDESKRLVHLTLNFMGNYNEPPLTIDLTLARANTDRQFLYGLDYQPRKGGPWNVQVLEKLG